MMLLIIFSASPFLHSCDGGGGGGAGDTDGDFTTAHFFPLTSSWETDNRTLFVDVGEHDVNGVERFEAAWLPG
jgi:hypothetical protein